MLSEVTGIPGHRTSKTNTLLHLEIYGEIELVKGP
jgi:hypothetical protein